MTGSYKASAKTTQNRNPDPLRFAKSVPETTPAR
jgi:hypothetical protein